MNERPPLPNPAGAAQVAALLRGMAGLFGRGLAWLFGFNAEARALRAYIETVLREVATLLEAAAAAPPALAPIPPLPPDDRPKPASAAGPRRPRGPRLRRACAPEATIALPRTSPRAPHADPRQPVIAPPAAASHPITLPTRRKFPLAKAAPTHVQFVTISKLQCA